MDAVHAAVHGTPVEEAVDPIVVGILDDEEANDLRDGQLHGREGEGGAHVQRSRGRVEAEDQGEFDAEVDEEKEAGALPLLCQRGEFAWLDLYLRKMRGRASAMTQGRHRPK